jgi:hypothetical protein
MAKQFDKNFIPCSHVLCNSFLFCPAVSSRAFVTEAPKVSFESVADIATSTIAQSTQLIATSNGDFGGAFFPVLGLASLGALILFLAPPLADE